MGCASSTPMIQTSGSEMLKAATHVAADATKTAEDAVEGIKDSVGKSLETAKDSVATTVESVKHEVENVVKEKSEMLGDATNSLMEKLHLKQTEDESNDDSNSNKKEENIVKTETDALKTQLNENLKHSNGENDTPTERTEATKAIKEYGTAATDTETDSLKTSTPEPEIERALAKGHDNQEDENDNPPTPKPTLAELENLTAELFKHQQQQDNLKLVNDTTMNNDPVMSVMHENIKTLDSNNMMSLVADNNTIKDNEPILIPTPTTTTFTNNDAIKSNNVHDTTQTNISSNTQTSLLPQTLTTSAKATAMAVPAAAAAATASQVVREKIKLKKAHTKEETVVKKIDSKCEEKRPKTTEWEKFADMLAQIRKFNPHDAYRRGGTLTKFGVVGVAGQLRERSLLSHHMRNGMDDDVSDTTSNFRPSPQNSQRSSARPRRRVQGLPNRPNTGNNGSDQNEFRSNKSGGNYAHKPRRNSNNSTTTGRKFYFNPTRSRINDFVSSSTFIQSSLQNTVSTPTPYAPHSRSYESVKSPVNKRSHHSRSEMRNLPPLEFKDRTTSISQQDSMAQNHQHQHQDHHHHLKHDNTLSVFIDHNGSLPIQNDLYRNETPILTRQSSNISLYSKSSRIENSQTFKSSNLDVRLQPIIPSPVKNTSSFLTTPRCSPFGLTKSYTDLYFSTNSNKENKPNALPAKSPNNVRKSLPVSSKKY